MRREKAGAWGGEAVQSPSARGSQGQPPKHARALQHPAPDHRLQVRECARACFAAISWKDGVALRCCCRLLGRLLGEALLAEQLAPAADGHARLDSGVAAGALGSLQLQVLLALPAVLEILQERGEHEGASPAANCACLPVQTSLAMHSVTNNAYIKACAPCRGGVCAPGI